MCNMNSIQKNLFQLLVEFDEICKKYASICSSKGIEASCSCGLKLCRSSDDISMSLIDKADRALYVSKQEGKGHCVIFGEDR